MGDEPRKSSTTRSVAGVALCVLALPSCRDPTQARLEIETNAQCPDLRGTSITVGKLGSMENKPPVASTSACDEHSGQIGSFVLVPSGDKNEDVAVRVVTGLGKTPQDCVDSGYQGGCIVARRAFHYLPHETLFLPIEMSVDCTDVACDATETCFHGNCVPAKVDPTSCIDPKGCVPNADAGLGGTGGLAGAGGTGGLDAGGGTGGLAGGGGAGALAGSGGSGGLAGSGGSAGAGGSCAVPLADCDKNGSCEVDVSNDPKNCGACGVSCLSGACKALSCNPVLVAQVSGSATAIATDANNVYWSDPSAGLVWQAPLAGGAPLTLATGQAFAQGVTVDATWVYWSNWTNNGRVARVPIGGGPVQVISEPEGFPANVALDDSYAYWTAGNSQSGVVRRALKTGGSAPQQLASGQLFPFGIGIDSTYVYWANWTANGVINKVAKDGSGGVMPVTLTEKSPYGVCVYAGDVFFTLYNAQGQVRRVPANGTNATSTLIAGGFTKPGSVAVDASGTWWTTQGDAVYFQAPGATPITVVSGVAGLRDIAVGPKAVCWATAAGPVCKGK